MLIYMPIVFGPEYGNFPMGKLWDCRSFPYLFQVNIGQPDIDI